MKQINPTEIVLADLRHRYPADTIVEIVFISEMNSVLSIGDTCTVKEVLDNGDIVVYNEEYDEQVIKWGMDLIKPYFTPEEIEAMSEEERRLHDID